MGGAPGHEIVAEAIVFRKKGSVACTRKRNRVLVLESKTSFFLSFQLKTLNPKLNTKP